MYTKNPAMLAGVLIVITIFCFILFFNQSMYNNPYKGDYISDTGTHVELTMKEKGYSLFHMVLGSSELINRAINFSPKGPPDFSYEKQRKIIYDFVVALLLSLCVLASILIIYFYLYSEFPKADQRLTAFLSISLLFTNLILIFPHIYGLFIGLQGPNAWHNPTLIFCKPLCLLVFIYVLNMKSKFEAKQSYIKEAILIAVFSMLCMWAKPSFLLSFLPSVLLVIFYLFFRKKISLKFLVIIGMSFSISLIPFFLIKSFAYENYQSHIVFAFGRVFKYYSRFIPHYTPLFFVLNVAFPLYVFVVSCRKRLSFPFVLSFVNYIASFLISLCLAEKGERMTHGNFLWTYQLGIFMFFVFAVREFFFVNTYSRKVKIAGWCLFGLHLLSGIFYFIKLSLGYPYF